MPTYEYRCQVCGHTFEQRQSMTAAPLEHCPVCGRSLERLVSGGGGFIVRGGHDESMSGKSCSLETTGRTCCGRSTRCGSPGCGESAE